MPESPATTQTAPRRTVLREYTAILARFPDEKTALSALKSLDRAQGRGEVSVDDVMVVRSDPGARLHVRAIDSPGLSEGLRIGAVFGMLIGSFFPRSRLVQTIAWAFIGAYIGTLQQEARKAQIAAALTGALSSNETGILAIIRDSDASEAVARLPGALGTKTTPIGRRSNTRSLIAAARLAG